MGAHRKSLELGLPMVSQGGKPPQRTVAGTDPGGSDGS